MQLDSSAVAIMVAITPQNAGQVHIAGLRVRYAHGMRRGDQRTGMYLDTNTG